MNGVTAKAVRSRSVPESAPVAVLLAVLAAGCTTAPSTAATVPYPNSAEPAEVLANIKFEFRRQGLAQGMPGIALADLKVRRILEVRSEKKPLPSDYLVVELEDSNGRARLDFALTRGGVYMGSADCRQCPDDSRPLDKDDAAIRVRNHGGGNTGAAVYVYFDNLAERGSSIFRPLVAVTTDRGVIYLNSKAQAFAEEGSPLVAEYGADQGTWAQTPPGFRQLRPLGRW